MGSARRLPAEADPGRRRTLGAVPLAIGAVSLGVLALRLVPDWYRAIFNPPEAGLSGFSPPITPGANFYVVSQNFSDPLGGSQGWGFRGGRGGAKPLPLLLARPLP